MNIEKMRKEAEKSPCKIIKFSASDGNIFSHNGEFYADCKDCSRKEIEQTYPQCTANHAEWGLLAKLKDTTSKDTSKIYIYCMTPDENGNWKDYPFKRFWCYVCSILLPMFGIKDVYMWNGDNKEWIHHNAKDLIKEIHK